MARSLVIADEAIDDLDAIWRWQTQPGAGRRALRRLHALREAIRRLKDSPCAWAAGARPGTREFSCVGHRIVYLVRPDTGSNETAGDVFVLRVFGPRQSRDVL